MDERDRLRREQLEASISARQLQSTIETIARERSSEVQLVFDGAKVWMSGQEFLPFLRRSALVHQQQEANATKALAIIEQQLEDLP